ncbi:MAG: hypothetical protein LBN26_05635 [Christensenellaceae bacterium]|jgi:hypothetical protein|nr:hypothetical protein [Christensenellaceae bacterium]
MQQDETRLESAEQQQGIQDENEPETTEEQQDIELEPSDLERKVAAIPPAQWKAWQAICGGALGVISGLGLYFARTETFSAYGFPLALILMMLVPSMVARSVKRDITYGRRIALLAFALMLVLQLALLLLHII